jgi:hypothetical protein
VEPIEAINGQELQKNANMSALRLRAFHVKHGETGHAVPRETQKGRPHFDETADASNLSVFGSLRGTFSRETIKCRRSDI